MLRSTVAPPPILSFSSLRKWHNDAWLTFRAYSRAGLSFRQDHGRHRGPRGRYRGMVRLVAELSAHGHDGDDQLVEGDEIGAHTTGQELRQWLSSEEIAVWSAQPDWPTLETKPIWMEFARNYMPIERRTWADRRYWAEVTWLGAPPPPGTIVQIYQWASQPRILSVDGTPLGTVRAKLNPLRAGLLRAHVGEDVNKIEIIYLGPNDLSDAP